MRWALLFLVSVLSQHAFAQSITDSISAADVQKHLFFLASDSLKGRGNYTPEQHVAARYIAAEFEKAGAQFLPSLTSFYQPFTTKKAADSLLLPDAAGRYNSNYVLLNVIGVLPGKRLANEAIIFSAHYDHIGMEKKSRDSIFNGANDNASGTAALLTLMQYYVQKNNNDRTLIFCAFAGEELGLKGSQVLAEMINPATVKALVNIEMIGRHGAVGKNCFFITGARRSNLAAHFKKALAGKSLRIKSEPNEEKQLFMRSDNFPFALKGIPAHTLMCSDDDDGCYHQTCDEATRIDIPNMAEIIKAIVLCSQALVDGSFTPSRIRL
jgi:hypothetical protein